MTSILIVQSQSIQFCWFKFWFVALLVRWLCGPFRGLLCGLFAVTITESTSNANAQTSTPPSNNNVIPEDVAINQVNDGFDTIVVNAATTLETNDSAAPAVNNNTITNATSATNTTIADLITLQKQKTVNYIEMSCILSIFYFYSLYWILKYINICCFILCFCVYRNINLKTW